MTISVKITNMDIRPNYGILIHTVHSTDTDEPKENVCQILGPLQETMVIVHENQQLRVTEFIDEKLVDNSLVAGSTDCHCDNDCGC